MEQYQEKHECANAPSFALELNLAPTGRCVTISDQQPILNQFRYDSSANTGSFDVANR